MRVNAKMRTGKLHKYPNLRAILPFATETRLVQASENDGLIFVQIASGFAAMVQRKGFAMVALK